MRAGNAIGAAVVSAALIGLAIEATTSFAGAPAQTLDDVAVDGTAETAVTTVIEDFSFAPIRTVVGAEVTWQNTDGAPHTVAADDGSFESPLLDGEVTFRHRFDRPGTFTYVCTVHPTMRGVVEVVAGAAPDVEADGRAPGRASDPYRSSGG